MCVLKNTFSPRKQYQKTVKSVLMLLLSTFVTTVFLLFSMIINPFKNHIKWIKNCLSHWENNNCIWIKLVQPCIRMPRKGSFINCVRVPREGKNIYILLLWGRECQNPFLRNIFQVDILLEIAQSSGLAGITFHLRLEGKKRIRMSCFLLVLQRMNSVKYNCLMLKNEMASYVRIGGMSLKNLTCRYMGVGEGFKNC